MRQGIRWLIWACSYFILSLPGARKWAFEAVGGGHGQQEENERLGRQPFAETDHHAGTRLTLVFTHIKDSHAHTTQIHR